ncbi:MAG: hypothetical protein ACREP9_09155, partial [Candidatus Dormibacteraceae bacterium]
VSGNAEQRSPGRASGNNTAKPMALNAINPARVLERKGAPESAKTVQNQPDSPVPEVSQSIVAFTAKLLDRTAQNEPNLPEHCVIPTHVKSGNSPTPLKADAGATPQPTNKASLTDKTNPIQKTEPAQAAGDAPARQESKDNNDPPPDTSKAVSPLPAHGASDSSLPVAISPGETRRSNSEIQPTSGSDPTDAPKTESNTEINPPARPQPAREIALRLPMGNSPTVDLRISERAGAVHVAVRTQDTDLARSLRSDIGELVGRLDRKGFETETWTPSGTNAMTPWKAEPGRQGGDPRRDGSPGGNPQQNQDQREGRQRQPSKSNWSEQFTSTISTGATQKGDA